MILFVYLAATVGIIAICFAGIVYFPFSLFMNRKDS